MFVVAPVVRQIVHCPEGEVRSSTLCGEDFTTIWIRDGEVSGDERTWVDFDAYVSIGEHAFYLQRFGFEIALHLEADPMTSEGGPVAVQMRKLEAGSAVKKASTTFRSEAYGVADRKVRLELPDGAGRLTMILRDTEDGHLEGSGGPKFVTLFDATKM